MAHYSLTEHQRPLKIFHLKVNYLNQLKMLTGKQILLECNV